MNNLRRRQIKGITQRLGILRRELGKITDEEWGCLMRSENLRGGDLGSWPLFNLDEARTAIKNAAEKLESVDTPP